MTWHIAVNIISTSQAVGYISLIKRKNGNSGSNLMKMVQRKPSIRYRLGHNLIKSYSFNASAKTSINIPLKIAINILWNTPILFTPFVKNLVQNHTDVRFPLRLRGLIGTVIVFGASIWITYIGIRCYLHMYTKTNNCLYKKKTERCLISPRLLVRFLQFDTNWSYSVAPTRNIHTELLFFYE